jgi:DNA-binding PucR family transcriptional regulator
VVTALVAGSVGNADGVATRAALDAGLEPALLGGYLHAVLEAARAGRRLERQDLDACRRSGEEAAEQGIALAAVLDLYLSGTWRLWGDIAERAHGADPAAVAAVAAAFFRAADDGAAALAEGYEQAQRRTVRYEESLRREFVDDLLSGGADPDILQERAARFGFNLAGSHAVTVARADRRLVDAGPVHRRVEAHVLAAFGGRDAVVATKEGLLVCVFPCTDHDPTADLVHALEHSDVGPWRVGVGDGHPGPGGVVRSYGEARQALELAARGAVSGPVARFGDLLPWRVLVADRSLPAELVTAVLGPLDSARGGAQHLIDTLDALATTAGNLSAAARSLNISSRAVVYRLERITQLTGYSPQDPDGRFVLELAVRVRRLLITPPAAGGAGLPPA